MKDTGIGAIVREVLYMLKRDKSARLAAIGLLIGIIGLALSIAALVQGV